MDYTRWDMDRHRDVLWYVFCGVGWVTEWMAARKKFN